MAAKRIVERLTTPHALDAASAVDEAGGVIRGVVLCGFDSANGRKYPRGVLESNCGKYEGAKAHLNHSRDGRVFQDWVGVIRNAKPGPDGRPRGDLVLFKSDPNTPKIIEAAQKAPDKFGMSHVALCRTRYEAGIEVVEGIDSVESVDVVIDPATVSGLLESRGGRTVATIKEYLDRLAPRLTLKQVAPARRLAEDDYGGMPMSADAPPADDAGTDVDSAIDAAFESAGIAVWRSFVKGDIDLAAALGKLKDLAKAHGNVTDSGGGEKTETETAAAAESRQTGAVAATREALDVCRKVGFRGFDADDLDMIASAAPARREGVAKRLMGSAAGTGGERPESVGRDQAATLTEEREAADKLRESKGGKKPERLTWED